MRTRSPTVRRTQFFRILPEMCASTSCWLASKVTRNMVPGSTDVTVPSTSMESSAKRLKLVITCVLFKRLVAYKQRPAAVQVNTAAGCGNLDAGSLVAGTLATATAVTTASATVATASTAAITTTTATTSAESAAAAAAFFTRACFVHGQGATINALAAELLDGSLGAFWRCHGNEGKTAGLLCEPISNDVYFGDRTAGCKEILQLQLARLKREITDKQFGIHDDLCPD